VEAVEHAGEEGGVGGIAVFDDPVEDEAARASGEGELVTVVGVAAVLADDVGVGLEDRDQLLVGGNGFAVEDAALGLGDDLRDEGSSGMSGAR